MRVKGLHEHRLLGNPEERRFAEAWAKINDASLNRFQEDMFYRFRHGTITVAEWDRDAEVAATVIQWLGSPVGQAVLRDLGYERKT